MTYLRSLNQSAFRHIIAIGHSGMAGGGTDDVNTRGWGHMLAAMLGAHFENYARGGADAVAQEQTGTSKPGGPAQGGSGGWAQLLGTMSPATATTPQVGVFPQGGISPIYPPQTHVAGEPYTAPPWLPLIFLGNNDLGAFGNSTRSLNAYLDAMRTILSRCMAAAVYEENDSSVGFNNVFGTKTAQGSWAASLGGSFGLGSGADLRTIPTGVTTTGTGGITINVPADYQQGDIIALGITVSPSVTAGQLTVLVDGVATGLSNGGLIPLANRTPGNGKTLGDQYLGLVYRLGGSRGPNLTSGTHTITINITTAVTGSAYFDYWQVEPGAFPPAIAAIVPSLFKPYQYGLWPTPLPTDADVDAWNNALSSMLTNEFPRALYVDISSLIPRTSVLPYWYTDQTHPSNLGHAMIAGAVFEKMQAKEPALTATTIAHQVKEPARPHIAIWQSAGATWPTVSWTTFGGSLPLTGSAIGSPAVPPEVVIPGSIGDLIEVGGNMIWDNTGTGPPTGYADVAIMGGYASTTPGVITLVAGTWTPSAVGTFYYWLSLYNGNGEAVAGGPSPPITVAANQNVQISFWVPNGTTGVRIYRTTSSGYPTSGVNMVAQVTALTQSATNTYTDTGVALTGTSPPGASWAYTGPTRYASGVGNGFWLANGGTYLPVMPNAAFFTVQPGDPVAGSLNLRLAVRVSGSTRGISGGSGNLLQFYAKNHGRQSGRVDVAA